MSSQSTGRLPDFVCIGAMKAATTTISYQLGKQPGIYMASNPKELYFFSHDHNYEKGENWYKSKFSDAQAGDLCGEATTTYTKLPTFPNVVERMHGMIPNAKLLYIMRHPIDRLISQYLHEVTLRHIKVDINRAIHEHPELIFYSLYAMQLQPFIDQYGADRILPIFFERLVNSSQSELERICQFIGYAGQPKWDFEAEALNVTKKRPIVTPWLRFVRKSKLLYPIRRYLIPQWLKTKISDSLASNLEKPEISAENISYLKEIFDRDLSTLGSWLGIQLNCNNFKEVVASESVSWKSQILDQRASFPQLNAVR